MDLSLDKFVDKKILNYR